MKNLGLQFTADFPDDMMDEGEGDDWHVVRPGGMALSHAIVEILRGKGLSVSEPDADLEHESWVFTAEWQGKSHSTQIYDFPTDKFLHVWGSSPWLKNLLNRRDFYLEYLELLRTGLCDDPRFGSVEWIDVNNRPISVD